MENKPLVSITVVVHNGERLIRDCLKAACGQTYQNTELLVFDNCSTDRTSDIVRSEFPAVRFIEHPQNLGMWPGHQEALKYSRGEYLLALSVDVILHPDFTANAVAAAERDTRIGAVQAKMYQYEHTDLERGNAALRPDIIDTCGFKISRSRRVMNIGHGQKDSGQYGTEREIFGVEGAAPFFRISAFRALNVGGHIADPDYFWYGDDLDLAWRMRLFGFRQVYVPSVIAYHDRSTTKGFSANWTDYFKRIRERRKIPLFKRRLDWANVRFTIIKNDYIINILKDLPWIATRELAVLGYAILFEPGVLGALSRFFKLLPVMLARRSRVMAKAQINPQDIHRWFTA